MYLPCHWLLPVLTLASRAAAVVHRDSSVSQNCKNACKLLQYKFGSTALHYYSKDNTTFWDAKQQEVEYACRVEPADTADVATVLGILSDTWCNFAVKCGGHSRDPDFSNSVGGVTVDLNRLHQVEIADDGSYARIGGGTLTAQAYEALGARNLSFVGGRVGTVGVGGFATGGGTSPLSARHGWALDNIYEYELVLPNATVVTVNEGQNPELYWALRGAGGGNFGIVTAFVVRTFPQGPLFTARRSWNETYMDRAVDEAYNLWTVHDNDTNISLDTYFGYAQASDSFTLAGTQRYLEPIRNPPVFASMNQVPAMSVSEQIDSLARLSGPGVVSAPLRHVFQTLTNFPSRELLREAFQIFREEIEPVKSVPGFSPQYITYPIPLLAIRRMGDRGGNALGLSDVRGPLFITLLSIAWQRPEDDAIVGAFSNKVIARVEDAARRLAVYHDYKYVGYGRLGQDIFSSYGAENQAKLRKVQESVDPKGIFTAGGLCRGGFKLG